MRAPMWPLRPVAVVVLTITALFLPFSNGAALLAAAPSAPKHTSTNSDVTSPNTTPIPTNIKIMVAGDSISQGKEGDFTWRYRLWEWFQPLSPNTTLTFVGPYTGTLPASVNQWDLDPMVPHTTGPYNPSASPGFTAGNNSAHFAVWGRPAWQDVDLITAQVAAHAPDYLVLHLGFNDIGWWQADARALLEFMQKLVWNARLGRSDVRVLVANVAHRKGVKGREDIPAKTDLYDAMLEDAVRTWTTATSPVELVDVRGVYQCHVEACPAGSDGLHPNALGDYQIARAYTQVLIAKFGIGTSPLEVPSYIRGLDTSRLTSRSVSILVFAAAICLVLAILLRRPDFKRRFSGCFPGRGRYRLVPSR